MIKQPMRYETNQKIKRILVSQGAHLGDLTFSFTGKAAFFTVRLNKISGTPMAYQAVEQKGSDQAKSFLKWINKESLFRLLCLR
jgi:hypothetical protein